MDGIINVYKEKGYSSFDVVARLRGITKQRRMGHTGTLDPAAEGVLPVALGTSTRIVEMLEDRSKTYRAKMALGVSTDTQDFCGRIVSTAECTASDEEIREAALSFIGEYDQLPPMYSAIQKDGKRLYEFARSGREVERSTKKRTIISLEVGEIKDEDIIFVEGVNVFNRKDKLKNRELEAKRLGLSTEEVGLSEKTDDIMNDNAKAQPDTDAASVSETACEAYPDREAFLVDERNGEVQPDRDAASQSEKDGGIPLRVKTVVITVTCSKGTYIRTLCNDIGEKLSCGGSMMELLRTETAGFTIAESKTLSELEVYAAEGRLEELLVAPDTLMEFPHLHVKPSAQTALKNGNVIFISSIVERVRFKAGGEYLMYDHENTFYGVYSFEAEKKRFRPRKMFID